MKDKNDPKLSPILTACIIEPKYAASNTFAHLNLQFRYRQADQLEFYLNHDHFAIGYDYSGLWIANQIDGDRHRNSIDYARQVEYHYIHSLNAREAAIKSKTLTHIDRKYQAMVQQLREPATYGQYVCYIAKIVKASWLAVPSKRTSGEWNYMSIEAGSYWIDEQCQALRDRCMALEAAAA
jgi:hypothetical protein